MTGFHKNLERYIGEPPSTERLLLLFYLLPIGLGLLFLLFRPEQLMWTFFPGEAAEKLSPYLHRGTALLYLLFTLLYGGLLLFASYRAGLAGRHWVFLQGLVFGVTAALLWKGRELGYYLFLYPYGLMALGASPGASAGVEKCLSHLPAPAPSPPSQPPHTIGEAEGCRGSQVYLGEAFF